MTKTVKVLLVAALALGSLNAWAGKTNGGVGLATRLTDSRDCGCNASSKTNPETQSMQIRLSEVQAPARVRLACRRIHFCR